MLKRFMHTAKPRTIITVCTIGLPLIMLLIGLLLAQQTMQDNAANEVINHYATVRLRLERVFLLLQNAQSGVRGYLLTGEDFYLAPMNEAKQQTGPQIALLGEALKSEPDQTARLRRVQVAFADKLSSNDIAIGMARKGDHAGVVARMRAGISRAKMTAASDATADLEAALDRKSAAAQAGRQAGIARAWRFAGSLLAALVLLTGFSGVMAFLNSRAKKKEFTEVRHLTEQLRAEKERLLQMVEELRTARLEAENANKAKSEFLAGMSHELRTPLNAILGFSEIIKDELFGPVGLRQYVDYANDVHKSGQHLLDLINDVLDLSKIQAGKVELREEAIDLSRLLRDSISLMRDRAHKGVVTLVFDEDSAAPLVLADRRLIKQILLNLLSNAIKFTPERGTVSARTFADGQGLGITIQDTGIGMDAAGIIKAMSPYGQVDSKLSRKSKGTGLGLPISQSLAQLHGGELVLVSAPGKGTTITLKLPVGRAVQVALAVAG
jgi:signal transduction histidine kinase